MRMYDELAVWWPLLSPAHHYVEEAAHLLPLLEPDPARTLTLLELGSGGGSLAWHLREHFELTLTDISPKMLSTSREVHPDSEHVLGDMRTIRLGRTFDRVLIHDAIMYLTTSDDVLQALITARQHCDDSGHVVVVPDFVAETYEPGTDHGGEDAPDGRGLRYLEWHWDPDSSDTTCEVAYAFLMRDGSGDVRVDHDRHRCGVFPRATWLALFARAGFTASSTIDPWKRDVFVARPNV
jgi:SAM-dependent methyltransferase